VNIPGGNIALTGFMGTGKTTIGRRVAAQLGYRLVDTDQMVVQRAGAEISEIFREHGESHFRKLEAEALQSLADSRELVIATGGGLVTRSENIALLRQLAFVVWLTASEEVIYERVSRNARRPLVQTPNPRETIRDMLAQRAPLYRAAADCTIDTSARSHAEVAAAVIEAAAQQGRA
jgi:shikimate kinase